MGPREGAGKEKRSGCAGGGRGPVVPKSSGALIVLGKGRPPRVTPAQAHTHTQTRKCQRSCPSLPPTYTRRRVGGLT